MSRSSAGCENTMCAFSRPFPWFPTPYDGSRKWWEQTSIQNPVDVDFQTFRLLRRVRCRLNQGVEFGLKGRRLHSLQ